MSLNKTYAVFGLGRYGYSVAKELINSGAEVIAVDKDPNVVNYVAEEIPVCKCADVTDPEVIERLGIADVDIVITAMAENLESSVMAITLCKEAGVKTVISKCSSEMHRKIMLQVGADKAVFPECESGIRLAKNLLSSGFVDMMELSRGVSMIELEVKPQWIGKPLSDLHLRKKYSINVVAIKENDTVSTNITAETVFTENTKLIVIADTDKLNKLIRD